MNYTELYDAIVATTENTDTIFISSIPTFVKNAEKRIYQAVKIPALRKNATSMISPFTPYITIPTDYLSPWEFAAVVSGEYNYLLLKDVSFIREAYPSTGIGGTPKYYAQFDADTFIIGPTPQEPTIVELHYFYYPASIVTAATSWLGTNFEGVLLYGSLVEAAAFMKSEEDIVQQYTEQYLANLKLLKAYSDGKLSSSDYRK